MEKLTWFVKFIFWSLLGLIWTPIEYTAGFLWKRKPLLFSFVIVLLAGLFFAFPSLQRFSPVAETKWGYVSYWSSAKVGGQDGDWEDVSVLRYFEYYAHENPKCVAQGVIPKIYRVSHFSISLDCGPPPVKAEKFWITTVKDRPSGCPASHCEDIDRLINEKN